MAKDPKLDLLRAIPLFAGLSGQELERIARLVDEVDVPAGKVLMTQGEHGAEMFVVVEGRFTVERNGTVIRECGPGDSLGELALLSEGPRTATVVAAEPGRLLVAGHREFHSLMEVAPEISAKMMDVLARRVRSLDADADS
jgi:CRP/FNR family transcriptional regulator, cyclic AMP receptor protein